MAAVFSEGKVFAGLDFMIFPFIADDGFPFQSEDQRFARCGMFRKARTGTETHDDEFDFRRLDDVAIDDFPVLARYETGQGKEFSCIDIHKSFLLNRNFYINSPVKALHADRDTGPGDVNLALRNFPFAFRTIEAQRPSGDIKYLDLVIRFRTDVRLSSQGKIKDLAVSLMDYVLRNRAACNGFIVLADRKTQPFRSFMVSLPFMALVYRHTDERAVAIPTH